MRIRLASAAITFIVLMLAMFAALGVQAQLPAPTAQFPLWGTCGETSPSGLAAMTAFQSAVPIVLGDPTQLTCKHLITWKGQMPGERTVNPNHEKKISVNNPSGKPWPDVVTFSTAVAFLKTQLALTSAVYNAIKNAYLEVYGRPATPVEQDGWVPQVMAQKAWYATIAFAEIKKLNANQNERGAMLDRAYQASMGRNASDADRAYWLPRIEHYRPIVDATRAWLYSPEGVNDLEQTIIRSFTVKNGKAPTIANIKNRMSAYPAWKPKPIYSEMIK